MMSRTLYLLLLFFFSLNSSLSAETPIANLTEVRFEEDDQAYKVFLHFDRPAQIESSSVELINQTIQVNLPAAAFKGGKKSVPVTDSDVSSIYLYHPNPNLLRARLIFDQVKASEFEGRVQLSNQGNISQIKVTKKDLVTSTEEGAYPPIAFAENSPETGDLDADLEEQLLRLGEENDPQKLGAATTGEKDIPLNLEVKQAQPKEANLWMRLLWSLGLLAAMAIGLIFFGRRFSKPNLKVGGGIKIQTLAQHSLGPKKQLSVISVAGEALLIGVTESQITLIKSLALIDDELPEIKSTSFNSQLEVELPGHEPEVKNPFPEELFSIKDRISSRIKQMRPL